MEGEAEEARQQGSIGAGSTEKGRERGAREEEEGGPDGWGHPVSDCRKKKKRRRRAGLLREGVDGPVGRLGQKGGKVLFLFFSFSFSNSFQIKPFQLKFKPKLFKVFHNIL
jgi:hypothetical protein